MTERELLSEKIRKDKTLQKFDMDLAAWFNKKVYFDVVSVFGRKDMFMHDSDRQALGMALESRKNYVKQKYPQAYGK